MRFLITGVNGQLGYDIKKELILRGYNEIYAPSREDLDITNEEQVSNYLLNSQPDVVIHCAAYTAVDKAEDDKVNCYNVNVNGTKYLVNETKKINAKFIYISTDYVFDGTKDGCYLPNDITCPINYYGETKLLGEQIVQKYDNHIIVRISWVFGINGNNFIKTMLRLAETRKELEVVCDQFGSPTYTEDLSKLLVDMSLSDKKGIYHATNEGFCSWNEFAEWIFEVNNISCQVNPILTKDYKTTALRPLNSRMDKTKLVDDGFNRLPDWKDAVKRYCKVLKKEGNK